MTEPQNLGETNLSKHITILTLGSRGDIQPYMALGVGLHTAGYRVRLATHTEYKPFITQYGLDFAPVAGNPKELLEGEMGKLWLESGKNPLKLIQRLRVLVKPLLRQSLEDSWYACQDTDLILFSALGNAGFSIAEKLNIPCMGAWLQPLSRTAQFASFITPPLPLGGIYNRFTYYFSEQLSWHPFRSIVNQWRKEMLGLSPLPFNGPFNRFYRAKLPIIYGFSPHVVPKPPDWPAWINPTGYWFLDSTNDWTPPPALDQFLANGPPPIYIGFGSMTSRDPEKLTKITISALKESGQRGILLGGWGNLGKTIDIPANVFMIESVPHSWLFPKMAGVIHHGGAGTTAAGLRAGVPSIVIPFFADQPFWGNRVAALGVGPKPVLYQNLTTQKLQAAIEQVIQDKEMQHRAAILGQHLQNEDGIKQAIQVIEQHWHLYESRTHSMSSNVN